MNKNNVITIGLSVIAGLLLGGLATWAYLSKDTSAPRSIDNGQEEIGGTVATSTNNGGGTGIGNLADNTLIVLKQTAGTKVVVDTVKVSTSTWVVITEDSQGRPARILGAKLFDANMITGEVALLRSTQAGQNYHALLYADNGDRQFDYKADAPLAVNGEVVESLFSVE